MISAVADYSLRGSVGAWERGRMSWGTSKVVKKWVLRLASFPEGRE